LRFYLLIILVATAVVTIDLHLNLFYEMGKALRSSLFTVVSIITTTGFVTDNFDQWPLPSRIIILLLMFIGGCAGSTGGAIKCLRILLIIKHSYLEFYRLIHPHAVVVVKLGKQTVPADIMASIRSFFFLYISTAIAATLCMAFLGLDLISAFSAVATTLGNVGPGFGLVNPLSNFFEIPQAGKWILSFCMLLGRLEIFTVLVLFIPDFWKK
jgi:trk system potassium uptake protein TrkH